MSAIKDTLEGMTPEQRIEFLNNAAYRCSDENYSMPLTDSELEDVKVRITRLNIRKQELEDEKQLFTEKYKQQMKPVEAELEELVREARSSERKEFGMVWYVPSHSEGVTYKTAEGEIIGSRPITKEEKQLTIRMSEAV